MGLEFVEWFGAGGAPPECLACSGSELRDARCVSCAAAWAWWRVVIAKLEETGQFDNVGIDSLAGPSELVVIADATTPAAHVALESRAAFGKIVLDVDG